MYVIRDATGFLTRLALFCFLAGLVLGMWLMYDPAPSIAQSKETFSTQADYPTQPTRPSHLGH